MNQIFPPPNFIRTRSALEGIELYMPAPEKHEPVVVFNCTQCGGQAAYDIKEADLTCIYCESKHSVPHLVVGTKADKFEFTIKTLNRSERGWGESRQEINCQNCGSHISVPPNELTHTCVFCGSNKVIQREAPQEVLRPRFLVPFQLEATACQGIFDKWLGNHWLTPKSLQQLANLREFTGVYLPFWTFDTRTGADWKAEVGHAETQDYRENGEWKTRTVIKWRKESGHVRESFTNILISGTTQVRASLLGEIQDYDLSQLVRYDARLLAGLQAQAYEVPITEAWQKAREQMREQTLRSGHRQPSTSRVRNFSMTVRFADESWRYILLPAYIATYSYYDKPYQIAINGQRGTIAGPRPVDWRKLFLIVAAFFGSSVLALVVAANLTGQLANILFGLGLILLISAMLVTVVLFFQAWQLANPEGMSKFKQDIKSTMERKVR
ncbi:MAG: hypothetical protein ACPGWR_28410 [Ardenticatenaceae bacterium]